MSVDWLSDLSMSQLQYPSGLIHLFHSVTGLATWLSFNSLYWICFLVQQACRTFCSFCPFLPFHLLGDCLSICSQHDRDVYRQASSDAHPQPGQEPNSRLSLCPALSFVGHHKYNFTRVQLIIPFPSRLPSWMASSSRSGWA